MYTYTYRLYRHLYIYIYDICCIQLSYSKWQQLLDPTVDCRHQAATGAERVREKPTVARFATSIHFAIHQVTAANSYGKIYAKIKRRNRYLMNLDECFLAACF